MIYVFIHVLFGGSKPVPRNGKPNHWSKDMAKKKVAKFEAEDWADRLAQDLALELHMWRRKVGKDSIRAFAIECYPWHSNVLGISFLTDRELDDFDEKKYGKWATASWRLYAFPSNPKHQWPSAKNCWMRQRPFYDAAKSSDGNAYRRQLAVAHFPCFFSSKSSNSRSVKKLIPRTLLCQG